MATGTLVSIETGVLLRWQMSCRGEDMIGQRGTTWNRTQTRQMSSLTVK